MREKTKGQQLLSKMVVFGKYARYDHHHQRRETIHEIFMRYETMMKTKFPSMHEAIDRHMIPVYRGQSVPSMRALQFAGKAIEQNHNRMYNCAYMPIDNTVAFKELMYLLLCGAGVGYSVKGSDIENLPVVLGQPDKKPLVQYTIPDSIEGWADAILLLVASWTDPHAPFIIFDFDDIRPAGSEIKTSGGFAPGPEPLRDTMNRIGTILSKAQGRKLRSDEVFDMCCHISMAVYSGGIRRAATICLFDRNDSKMLYSKTGAWYDMHPQRAMANISVVLPRLEVRQPEFNKLFEIMKASNSGEPGFFWTNDPDVGCNPCGEISLRPFSFCNLSEVNVGGCTDQKEFLSAVDSATFFGTLQASFTDFKNLRPEWKTTTEEDSLVGVSLTGICTYEKFPFDLEAGAVLAVQTNEQTAKKIGIKPAKRVTTIKPSGTASLYFGTSSGIHPYYAPFYLRRMRLKKDEVLANILRDVNPHIVEDDIFSKDNYVISIPVESPVGAITRSESALEMLRRIRTFYHEWVRPGFITGINHNNISATLSVRPDEWDTVKRWMWENRDNYQGITVLPYNGSSYKQMPFEEIPHEEYQQLHEALIDVDFHLINEQTDHTNPSGEVACGGGSCEVSYL